MIPNTINKFAITSISEINKNLYLFSNFICRIIFDNYCESKRIGNVVKIRKTP